MILRHEGSPHTSRKRLALPKPIDVRKSIDGLAARVKRDIKVAVLDPPVSVLLNTPQKRVKILYGTRSGFCVWRA
ncbi:MULTISPECIES: IS66 family insertion sequence element accessory protein TnpB [unclassified Pseudomonas]|uniref:IS66 family insertion sequence element accessory protein TnpB n=1 Tax=unclassified Pseudomonas TaxID=196821 RepID=UPI001F5ACF37|nr:MULTISPECIES: IS66 family insertion sequence element accessory protein TnpB [unclassified Pseudomonas]